MGPVIGDPLSLSITSAIWTSSTDLTPASQFIDGYTADVVVKGLTPAAAISAYDFGAGAGVANGGGTSAKVSFPVVRPSWTQSGNSFVSSTVSDTAYGTSWLRPTYNGGAAPTEAANGGNAKLAITLNDVVNQSDTPGAATFLASFYTSGSASNAKSGVPVTNNSTQAYPRPVGVWVTPPGERVGGSQTFTAELFAGQSYGRNGLPAKGVTYTFCDAGCAHSFAKAVASMSFSAKPPSTTCTATNGSAVLTACGDTSRFIVGQRLTVIGIPGQPLISAVTSSTLTLGSAQTCTTTLNSGIIAVGGTPPDGAAMADGAFNGASLSDANITGPVAGVAGITSEIATADVTTASLKTTSVNVHTNATAVTAAASHACTINHLYQGSTGTVTVTAGQPVPVWSVTATAADFTGAGFVDGLAYVRAQVYPAAGDVLLDTQSGADGTGCDWFKGFVAGVCSATPASCTSVACFNVDGTDITTNLRNLSFYYDSANAYAPAYVWIKPTGTCISAACVSSSPADPGGAVSNYAASAFQAQANAKLFNNANRGHNDPMGAVYCETAGTYVGFGGNLQTATVAKKPPQTLTSALLGGNCPATGSANSDVQNVILGHHATGTNDDFGSGMRFNNVKISDSSFPLQGTDGAINTSFNTQYVIFNDDIFLPTANVALLQKVGVWSIYGSYIDEVAGDGRVLQPASATTGGMALLMGATATCASFTSSSQRPWWHYNSLGVSTFNCAMVEPTSLDTTNTVIQPLSSVAAYDKVMGMVAAKSFWLTTSNLLLANDVFEMISSNVSPTLQVSGDSGNTPLANIWRVNTTVLGGRTNNHYLEGVPVSGTAVASGGAFAAGTYFVQVTYAKVGNPTVETSTDGPGGAVGGAGTFTGFAVVLNGSIKVDLYCDPNYVAYIYVDTAVTSSGQNATLGHIGAVSGVDQTAVATCQTVTLTAIGSARTAISVAGTTSHNEAKPNFFENYNLDMNFNEKGDYFGGTLSQAGSFASGGKVGNWLGRMGARQWGNIAVTGTVVGTGGQNYGYQGGLGDFAPKGGSGGSFTISDLSWIKYKSDRSFGSNNSTAPQTPAVNLGQGNYCLASDTPHGLNQIPSGLAPWPKDIQGRAWANDGSDPSGAYAQGCT